MSRWLRPRGQNPEMNPDEEGRMVLEFLFCCVPTLMPKQPFSLQQREARSRSTHIFEGKAQMGLSVPTFA